MCDFGVSVLLSLICFWQKEMMVSPAGEGGGGDMFGFCESELFTELQSSEVASSSNGGGCTDDLIQINDPTELGTPTTILFEGDQIENEIDFTPSPTFENDVYLDTSVIVGKEEPYAIGDANQFCLENLMNCSQWLTTTTLGPPVPALAASYEEECLSSLSLPPYIPLTASSLINSNSFIPPPYFPATSAPFGDGGGAMLGTDFSHQDLEFQGDNINGGSLFLPDTLPRLETFTTGGAGTSSLEDPTFKVGKLSAEERKRKIHRYMKKRNERNFSKKIKYACRKTLADSRPRVRGRFAKNNDELGGDLAARTHEDDTTDEDMMSMFSDHRGGGVIVHHINGGLEYMNGGFPAAASYKHYPIQSWI